MNQQDLAESIVASTHVSKSLKLSTVSTLENLLDDLKTDESSHDLNPEATNVTDGAYEEVNVCYKSMCVAVSLALVEASVLNRDVYIVSLTTRAWYVLSRIIVGYADALEKLIEDSSTPISPELVEFIGSLEQAVDDIFKAPSVVEECH